MTTSSYRYRYYLLLLDGIVIMHSPPPPLSVTGEVYCFLRRQLICRIGGVSHVIQKVLIPKSISAVSLLVFEISNSFSNEWTKTKKKIYFNEERGVNIDLSTMRYI